MIVAGYLVCLLLSDLTIVFAPAGDLRAAAACAVLWILPGLAWGRALRGRWLAGLGLGITVNSLLTLLLHYLPGPISFGASVAVFTVSALVPALIRGRSVPSSRSQSVISPSLALLLLVAAAFRLPGLGYSEFQGDEGVIMVRAAAAMEGDDAELFLHQKGPVEILLPLATWRLSGSIDEFWARLPFAWASILGVAAAAQLGARWFGRRPGALTGAGFILAINGFHIAFGRIVQYQTVVVLMALLALLALDRYREAGWPGDLLLGTTFLAFGALSHYDAVLFAPAALALLVTRGPATTSFFRRLPLRQLAAALLLGVAVVSLFYLPYSLSPSFGKTTQYVAGDRVGGGLQFNVGKAWVMSTVYNSSYYVGLLLALLAVFVGVSLRPASVRATPLLAAWLVFLVPLIFYLILVFDPRTHVYTVFPGAALLAGAALDALRRRARQTRWRHLWLAAGAGLYALCAGYAWMVFVDHTPEYQRTYPAHKSSIYWTSYGDMPLYGRFGFPHRAGWHAVGELMPRGEIGGVYASNEEHEITDWYTRQAPRTHCPGPDAYVVAENVQDEIPIDWGELERAYQLAGTVTIGGEPRIQWYTWSAEETMTVEAAGLRTWRRAAEVAPPTVGGAHRVDFTLGGLVRLIGYDLDEGEAAPGCRLLVTLYWQSLTPLTRNYQVFTHLYDGQIRGQDDGAPECAINPTTRWEPGRVIRDPHVLPISAAAPPGRIPLLVGMYDLITSDRLAVVGTADDAIHLTDVTVREGTE